MANEKELKKITLHPIINGEQKEDVDLLSKTSVNNILSGSIDTGGNTPFDAGFTKDLKYEQIIKQEEVPVIPEDGDECTLPTTYNLDDFTFDPTDDEIIYNSIEDRIIIGLTTDAPTPGAIVVNTSDTTYLYMNYTGGKCWYYMPARSNNLVIGDTVGKPLTALVPTPYEGIISFNFDSNALQEGKELIFDKILGLNPQIIEVPVERTIEEKNADIKNWEYSKETKIKPLVEHQKYNLKNSLNSVKMAELLDDSSESYNYSSSIWSIDGNIIYTGLKAISEWTVLNKQTNRWEKLNVTFVNETRNVKCGSLSSYQIIYYNNKVYAARANTYNDKDEYLADLRFENYIYEITFDANTNTLTLTRHNLDLDGNSIYTCYVFEWDNKLLCKVYDIEDTSNNDIYELDLTNYTATLTEYNLLGYTYNSNTGYKQSLDRLNNLGNLVYNYPGDKWIHPIGNIVFAGSYNHNDCSKIRHTVADDQNYLADQTIVLDEYSIIIERVNENSQKAGLAYISNSEMGYIQDANGDTVLCTQNNYYDPQTTKYFIFNEGSNLFEEISYQINASIGNNKIGFNNVFYVNGVCYSYYAYYETLIKQTGFEDNTMIFGEDATNIPLNGLIYCNSEANENEVFSIGTRYNYITDHYYLCLNDTYYYETGTNWLDNLGNIANVNNLQILYDENNFNAVYPEETIETIADFTYIETTTLDQKVNEPLANKLYQVIEEKIEVPNDIIDDNDYYFKDNMEINRQTLLEYFIGLESEDYIYNNIDDGEYIQYIVDTPSGKVDAAYARLRYTDSSSNSYDYLIANIMSLEPTFINEWDGGSLDFPITIYTDYIVNEDILKLMLNIGTHKESIYKNQTLGEKVEDLPNWKYSSNVGLYVIPKWDAFAPYIDTWHDIYYESSSKQHANINFDYDTDYYGEGNCGIWVNTSSAEGNYGYCIYKENYQQFEANTWYDITDGSKLSVKLDNPPKLELDVQYAAPDYIDLFNAIYGEEIVTLKDELNSPLKDKTYDNITKTVEVPDEFIDGNYYSFKTNMAFSDSDQDMLFAVISAGTLPIYSEGENGSTISATSIEGRDYGAININYYDSYNDTEYYYTIATSNSSGTEYVNLWEGSQPSSLQVHTDAIINQDWFNRIFENDTHQETQEIPQTLEEKFKEVEAKINSHTDTGVLKDKIYDYTIELENGQEYSLATDMEPFFDRFSSDSYTLIYGSTNSGGGGGEMPMPMPIYDGNSVASPTSLMSNDGNGTRGGGIALEPALPADPVSPGGLGEIYITRITLVNTYTPPKEKDLLVADSGIKGGTELKGIDSVGLGETYVEVCDNFYNYYYYYKGADSWTNNNGDSVTAANLPKFKLDTALVQDFDMLKFVLQTIPQTLEAKLSEGIANWNYEQGKINSFPDYAPLFNVMPVLQTNSSILGPAGLFNDQNGTRIYQDDTTTIEWSCDSSNYTLNIYYGILDEANSLVYEINCNINMSNNTETWTGTAIPSTGGGGIIVAPATIYSQEELPFIKYYSPVNIESGYEQVVPLLLTEIYAKGEPTTLAQKIADIKNWEYNTTPISYKFKKTVNWSQLPAASEISDDIEIYYDDTTSWYTTLVLKNDTINYLLYKPQYLQALNYPQYRNYRFDYTDNSTGSTAEAGKWYYVEHVKTGQYSYGDKFIEVTPIEDFNSLYIVSQELFNAVVDSTEAQVYTVADMVEGPLKDKTYDNALQEKLVDNAEYNLKTELNTGNGNKLIAMSENCANPVANVGEYDNDMASPWTSFMLDGYLIATGANNSWYYLDENTTWQKIKNIEIINGSSAITDSNKRIASQGTFTYNNKTYLAWPTAWPNNIFNQYVIPCTDNYTTKMIYEIEFDPSNKTITLTGHKLSFNATPEDGYLYGNKFFEFNGALLYADSGYNNYIYEIDLENDTATEGIYNKFKCKYGSGTTINNIIAEETSGSFQGRHIITPINGVDFTKWHGADNNSTGTFFKIRHATAAEVAAYPDLNLSKTTSVIYDLINPANPTCGISSTVQSIRAADVRNYVAEGRFIYTYNGTNYLGSLYYYDNNGTTKYFAYKFNESTNTWSTVTLNRPTDISTNSFLSGNKFIYDDVSQNTYLVDDYKNIYRVTGLENNQINFEKVELHGTGYPYTNPAPEDGEVAQIECSYSADTTSYIDTLYIKDDGEIVPIAYCDGSDYWKDIDTDQQIDVSEYTVYNIRNFFDIHVDSSLIELIASLETDVPVTLEEKLDSLVVTFDADIAVNAWESTTDVDIAAVYPYQAIIQHNALINAIKCDVEFGLTDMLNDNYAPFFSCNDITGEIAIFAKAIPSDPITVKITRWLGTKLDDIIVDHTIHNSI